VAIHLWHMKNIEAVERTLERTWVGVRWLAEATAECSRVLLGFGLKFPSLKLELARWSSSFF
jgi:hypothetical protein